MTARHVRIIPLAIIFVALTPGVLVHAQVGDLFTGLVVGVTDGDTISVMRDGETVRIRLEGIDTPESGQAFGSQARVFTSSRVLNKRVTVHVRDVDRYGRLVSRVQVDGTDVSVALVTQGLAWHYTQYSDDPVLSRAEVQARTAEIGVWSQPSPVPPWEFRSGGDATREEMSNDGGASSKLPTEVAQWDDNGNGLITCAEARRHGIAPVRRSHPAYPYMRDGDNDGTVCE